MGPSRLWASRLWGSTQVRAGHDPGPLLVQVDIVLADELSYFSPRSVQVMIWHVMEGFVGDPDIHRPQITGYPVNADE